MGKKYSTQTAPTYADDTPADDGTIVATNQISANLIRTNYTDPIKNLADAINNGLIDHFDEGPDTKSATYVTVATDYAKVLECTGTMAVDLLAASTAGAGYKVTLKNVGSNTVTARVQSGETLDGTTDATVALTANQVREFIVNAGATGYMSKSSYDAGAFAGGITVGGGSVFDAYVEGTWTATLTTNGTDFDSVTYDAVRSAYYTQKGRDIHVQVYMRTDAVTVGSASGTVCIGGLPVTAASLSGTGDRAQLAVGGGASWGGDTPGSGFVEAGTTLINLQYRTSPNNGDNNLATTDVGTGANANIIQVGGEYIS